MGRGPGGLEGGAGREVWGSQRRRGEESGDGLILGPARGRLWGCRGVRRCGGGDSVVRCGIGSRAGGRRVRAGRGTGFGLRDSLPRIVTVDDDGLSLLETLMMSL